jgi:hypothetical protein
MAGDLTSSGVGSGSGISPGEPLVPTGLYEVISLRKNIRTIYRKNFSKIKFI